jgi:hypothetical protein
MGGLLGDLFGGGGPQQIEIDGNTLGITGTLDVQGGDPNAPLHVNVEKLQNIAPMAVHVKEVNLVDPISIESLFVSQVRNIEPLNIAKFNVTNLPQVNLAMRQLPPVELNVGRLPAVSIGTHQEFDLPSHYEVRARLLGFEFLRVQLSGRTRIAPSERYRREQDRADSRSFPRLATAGNPAIPSIRRETSAVCVSGPPSRGGLRVGHCHCGESDRREAGSGVRFSGSSVSSGG